MDIQQTTPLFNTLASLAGVNICAVENYFRDPTRNTNEVDQRILKAEQEYTP